MSKTLKLVAVVAAAAFTLVACGTDTDPGSSNNSTSTRHNDADVSFAQAMIPHHAQAIVMARMAKSQARDPRVKALASEIAAAQQPEISTMSDWLAAWGENVSSTDSSRGAMNGHDMGSMDSSDMPGMMTSAQMMRLGKVSGMTFDRMWLQVMIQHHQGAIEMAKAEQNDGQSVDAINLAEKIEAAQTAEIATMKAMLGS